jgi:ComF family protein
VSGNSILVLAADLVCPERCAGCETLVDPRALFCDECAPKVHRLGAPECDGCGRPQSSSDRCGPCRAPDAAIRAARAFAAYHGATGTSPIATAITHFKYGGARRLGRRLASALITRVPDPTVDLVMPVPLHVRRLRTRGFNQSALLARHVARHLGCPVALTTLVRTRDTPSQTSFGPLERALNVAAAFAVRDPARVCGRAVLLIDDVWTSGATVTAVARALRASGAAAVDVITVARVL